jgi:Beta/Gamma crystallin
MKYVSTHRALTFMLALAAAWSATEHTPYARGASSDLSVEADTSARPSGSCWAQLYPQKSFHGTALTVTGPADLPNLPPHWGFPWEPRYESLSVGAAASISLYDDTQLHDRTATFNAGTRVEDLDRQMGLFRRIRSLSVKCTPSMHVKR